MNWAAELGARVPHQPQRKRAANGARDGTWRWGRWGASTRCAACHVDDGGVDRVLGIAHIVNEYLHEPNYEKLALSISNWS